MEASMQQERDLVLPPNTFAYVLDKTKGKVLVYVGPFKTSLSNTDALVIWQDGKFIPTPQTEHAVQSFVEAREGQYTVLSNPTAGDDPERFPVPGMPNDATDLHTGRKVVIPGPVSFPLWAGQAAQVIDGHHLRHNQYLIVRVYEPEAAKSGQGIVAPQKKLSDEELASLSPEERTLLETRGDDSTPTPTHDSDFTMGELIVIRGVDVSFYVPPTGIEVVPEHGQFVREAVTLEQLEYCVLLDENGRKRFEKGPAVVFPQPTETFYTEEGSRKFRAIELNPQSGLYIKVIAPYEEDGVQYTEGQELFLTGEDTPIYFPRVEHSIIQYGDKRKHHAIAIPKGEGRYVLNRTAGEVDLVTGPSMFLPDPRTQVIVRRILPPSMVAVMYPGNTEALAVNEQYHAEREAKRSRRAGGVQSLGVSEDFLATEETRGGSGMLAKSYGGERMTRGTEFTPPRTITLDTKYEGAITVSPWPGYAVLIMDKAGDRRVEVGPKNILLKYDESLMVLSLSTGRPKNDYSLLRTPYLRTVNNSVSDQVTVETRDLVAVTLDLSLRVNFEGTDAGSRIRWFDVENYVALLTDHCRSKLRNLAKRYDIQEFYTTTIDLIRDTLLGEVVEGERRGLPFKENGMRLYDVEVLSVRIDHPEVQSLLTGAMDDALRGAIELSQAEQSTARQAKLEALSRERLEEQEKTRRIESEAAIARIIRLIAQRSSEAEGEYLMTIESSRVMSVNRANDEAAKRQEIALLRERNEVEIERLRGEVEQMIERAKALTPELVHAISQFGDQAFLERMMEAIGPVALATGVTTADTFQGIFKDTPFEGVLGALAERPYAITRGNGVHKDD